MILILQLAAGAVFLVRAGKVLAEGCFNKAAAAGG